MLSPSPSSSLKSARLVCLLTVTIVAFVASADAYDFADNDYNEYLMRDLIDMSDFEAAAEDKVNDAASQLRNKREADEPAGAGAEDGCKPLKRRHGNKCCNDETDSDNVYDQYRDLKRQCLRDFRANTTWRSNSGGGGVYSCEAYTRFREEAICVSQCVGRSLNIVDADGNLIPAAVTMNTATLARAGWQLAIAANVSATCLAENDAANNTVTPLGCSPAALELSYCVWRQFVLACPRELQNRANRCVALRDRLQNGENLNLQLYNSYRNLQWPVATEPRAPWA